jgi:hypothetical protein
LARFVLIRGFAWPRADADFALIFVGFVGRGGGI